MSRNSFSEIFSQYYVVYLVILVGILAGGGTYWYQSQIQRERLVLRFQELTDSPIQIVRQTFHDELDLLDEVRDSLELVSENNDEARVERYITRSLEGRNPRFMVLVDFPKNSWKRKTGRQFSLTTEGDSIDFTSYTYPREASDQFDQSILRKKVVRKALARTLKETDDQIAIPAQLVDERYGSSVFIVFQSVETLEMTFGEFTESPASPGFIMAVFDLNSLLQEALDPLEADLKRNFQLKLTDFTRRAGSSSRPLLETETGQRLPDESLRYATTIAFANREFRLELTPTEYFLKRYENNTAILSTTLITVVFLLIGGYLFQQTKHNRRIKRMAENDELTGLYARRFFMDAFQKEINRAKRYDHSLSLVIIDIDFFKDVNDEHGHQVGDEVLEKLGDIIRDKTRESDVAARYGGEEFAVLLPETNLSSAQTLAERINRSVSNQPFETSAGELAITVSIGVSALKHASDETDDVLRRADEALYESKSSGRDQVTVAPTADS